MNVVRDRMNVIRIQWTLLKKSFIKDKQVMNQKYLKNLLMKSLTPPFYKLISY